MRVSVKACLNSVRPINTVKTTNIVTKSTLVPRTEFGEIKLVKLNDLNLKSFFDCSLVIYQTRGVSFREACHIMLDTVIDTEFGKES